MPFAPPIRKQMISTDVPGAPDAMRGAGMVAEALSGVGQAVQRGAGQLQDYIQQAEGQDAADSTFLRSRLETEREWHALKTASPDGNFYDDEGQLQTNPDGTPRTITQEFEERANERFRQDQEAMPSRYAQRLYKEKAAPWFTSQAQSAFTDEQVRKIESVKTNLFTNDQIRSDSLVSQASLLKAYETSNESREAWQAHVGKLYPAPFATEQMSKNDDQFAESAVRYALNQIAATPNKNDRGFARKKIADYWIRVLSEDSKQPKLLTPESFVRTTHGQPILAEMLNPDKKAQLIHQLLAAKEAAEKSDLSALHNDIREAGAAYSLGKPGRVPLTSLEGRIRDAVLANKMSASEGTSLYATMAVQDRLFKAGNLAMLPPDQEAEAVRNMGAGVFRDSQKTLASFGDLGQVGSVAEKSIRDGGEQIVSKHLKERQNDFPAYVTKYDQGVQAIEAQLYKSGYQSSDPRTIAGKGSLIRDRIAAVDNNYSAHFPGDSAYARVISKPESEGWGRFLTSKTRSPEEVASAIKTMAQELGPDYPRVIDQMVRDKNLKAEWYFASMFSGSQGLTEDTVAALKTEMTQDAERELMGRNNLTQETLNSQINSKFGVFMKAIRQQDPRGGMAQMGRDAIVRVARNKALALLDSQRASGSVDAIDKAYEALVEANWHIKQTTVPNTGILGFFGRKYNMVIPKAIGGRDIGDADAQKIADYSASIMTVDGLKKLGAEAPLRADGKPSAFGEEFYKQVVSGDDVSGGRVVINDRERALKIWWLRKNDSIPAMVHKIGPDGKRVPLRIPIEEALNYKPEVPAAPPARQFVPGVGGGG